MKRCMTMRTSDFDYELPEELIAQHPPEHRGDSRMLVLDPAAGSMKIVPFREFPDYFNAGDLIAVNNTKVIKARLFAKKESGAKIEIMLLAPVTDTRWSCLLKPAKRVAPGTVLRLLDPALNVSEKSVRLVSKDIDGNCIVEFLESDVERTLAQCGHMPLPPYIRRTADYEPDAERYQTVYAKAPGAVAAPTAGLHFTKEILAALSGKGVKEAELTLHVGQGTFKPVTVENIEEHPMHSEHFILTEATAGLLNDTRRAGGRIAAIGTTSLRALESCVREDGYFEAVETDTSIFIYPPCKVKSIDMLLTNFHLPKSTLLMLVSAFAGHELVMEAYRYAVKERMRFFSYGDCMLILNKI